MTTLYEHSPFYRLFNVVLFILYLLVVLASIFTGFIAYSSRNVTSASVQCKDGTKWNATKIYYNSDALCGICTQRSPDNKNYKSCTYENYDYSSYDVVDKKYEWSWWIIIVPLIVLSIGFIIVDFLRIVVVYVLSGSIALEKSIFLRLLVAILASDKNPTD